MACTGLEFPSKEEGGENKRLKIMTQETEHGMLVSYYACDAEFIPEGEAEITVSEKTEEEFHRDLRAQADEKGHLVRRESTNPEWNPGYTPSDEPPSPGIVPLPHEKT